MIVKELIERLSKYNPEAIVLKSDWSDGIPSLLSIDEVFEKDSLEIFETPFGTIVRPDKGTEKAVVID